MDRPSGLIGVEIAQFVDGRMRRPDVLPAYARGQGYPARDAPGILDEGGMPLLALMIGIIAGYDASAAVGVPCQKSFQARKGDNAILARR